MKRERELQRAIARIDEAIVVRLTRTGSGHIRADLSHPKAGETKGVFSATPSDIRSDKNALADIRRWLRPFSTPKPKETPMPNDTEEKVTRAPATRQMAKNNDAVQELVEICGTHTAAGAAIGVTGMTIGTIMKTGECSKVMAMAAEQALSKLAPAKLSAPTKMELILVVRVPAATSDPVLSVIDALGCSYTQI